MGRAVSTRFRRLMARLRTSGGVITPPPPPLTAPIFSVTPAISGTPALGQTLTATTGTASGNPAPSYALQWRRDGSPISGVIGTSYVVQAADQGTALTVASTASNGVGTPPVAVSAALAIPAAEEPEGPVGAVFPTAVNGGLPVFGITPEGSTNPTAFTLTDLESLISGDRMWIEAATDDAFTANVTRHDHLLTDAELNAGPPYNFTFTGLAALSGGTRRYRPTLQRGTERSNYGTSARVGPNDVAPVLSALSISNITFTTANINVTTNYTPGTLYFLHTATNVAPNTAAMLAGTSQAVTSAGAKVQSVTGTSGDLRYAWVMHRPDAGPDSAVTPAGSIQFAVPVVSSAWDPTGLSSDLTLSDGNRTATMTSAAGPRTVLGTQARSSGKYWVEFFTDKNGGGGKPGIRDETANKTVSFADDSGAGDAGGGWTATWNSSQTSTIRFEVDFDTDQIQAFLNGTSAGTKAFPAGATSFKPWAEIVSVVGSKSTVNTGQATPMGTVTSGFSPWG